MPSWNWQKTNQANTKQHPDFWYLKIIHIPHLCYHPKGIGHILKNEQENMYACIHEIIWLIRMKMKIEMKNKSHRYNTNRSTRRHGYKYRKYKMHLIIIMLIRQHISNTPSHSLDHPLFFKGGEEILITSPSGEGNLKNKKKGVEVWCRGRSS